jgi:hypothetical protein
LTLFLKESFVHFDTICVNLSSSVVSPKDTGSGRKLQQNVMFVLVLQSPECRWSLSVVPQENFKKSDFSLWRGTFGRQRGTEFSTYPGSKPYGFFFSPGFLMRILSTFSLPPSTKALTLLEVPEFHVSGLLAAVEMGLSYLGYQPARECVGWFMKQGFAAMKEASDGNHWDEWISNTRSICQKLKRSQKRPAEQAVSLPSKRKKILPLASSPESSKSSSTSSSSDSEDQ